MSDFQFVIAGVDKTTAIGATRGVSVEYTLGGRTALSCTAVDKSANTITAYRPTTDQRVGVAYGGVQLFAGSIMYVEDSPLGGAWNRGVETKFRGTDDTSALSGLLLTKEYDAGYTLREIVIDIFVTASLGAAGIYLNPSMADGPIMGKLTFDGVSVADAFARLATLTGWVYRLPPTNIMEFFEVGDKVFPYTLSAANANIRGGVTWSKTLATRVTKVIIRYGTEKEVLVTETLTGNGSTTSWPLKHRPVVNALGMIVSRGVVKVSGADETIGIDGDNDATWGYSVTANTIRRVAGAPAGAAAIEFVYTVQFPQEAAYPPTSVAGQIVGRYSAPEIFEKDEAEALAEATLRQLIAPPRQLQIRQSVALCLPGTVVPLNLPERLAVGSWLCTETRASSFGNSYIAYDMTLVEGSESVASWVTAWRARLGGGNVSAGSGGTITGTFIPASSGQFTRDVIGNTGQNDTGDREASLRGGFSNSEMEGPGVQLGTSNSDFAWRMVADHLQSSPASRGLYFVPVAENGTTKYAMRLGQQPTGADGEYWLTHNGDAGAELHIGAKGSSGFGPGFRATSVNTEALDASGATVLSGGVTLPTGALVVGSVPAGFNGLAIGSAAPVLDFYESGAASNSKFWRWIATSVTFLLQSVNDAYTSATTLLSVDRSGNVMASGSIGGAAVYGQGVGGRLLITDGITAPGTIAGLAQVYVDSTSGDLMCRFGDGSTKTIVTD